MKPELTDTFQFLVHAHDEDSAWPNPVGLHAAGINMQEPYLPDLIR